MLWALLALVPVVWGMAFYAAVTGDLSWHSQFDSLNNPLGWGIIYIIAFTPPLVLILIISPILSVILDLILGVPKKD